LGASLLEESLDKEKGNEGSRGNYVPPFEVMCIWRSYRRFAGEEGLMALSRVWKGIVKSLGRVYALYKPPTILLNDVMTPSMVQVVSSAIDSACASNTDYSLPTYINPVQDDNRDSSSVCSNHTEGCVITQVVSHGGIAVNGDFIISKLSWE
jgi:hypothetical protein